MSNTCIYMYMYITVQSYLFLASRARTPGSTLRERLAGRDSRRCSRSGCSERGRRRSRTRDTHPVATACRSRAAHLLRPDNLQSAKRCHLNTRPHCTSLDTCTATHPGHLAEDPIGRRSSALWRSITPRAPHRTTGEPIAWACPGRCSTPPGNTFTGSSTRDSTRRLASSREASTFDATPARMDSRCRGEATAGFPSV